MRAKNLLFIIITLIISTPIHSATISIKNPAPIGRSNETIELNWKEIVRKLPEALPENIVVCDESGRQIPSQVIYNGTQTPQTLIFQATVPAKGKVRYRLTTGRREAYPVRVFGRFVPERMDDFAWENDRIAHRMYGPALQATGEISNGIDVWLKKTDRLIIDKWFKKGNDYHTDHGEGLDCYKVGRTLGAGAMAPYTDDRLWLADNYIAYEVLDNGPLRISFKLEYAPFDVAGKSVRETRYISLDANTSFNRITEIFEGDFTKMPVAAGIVLRNEPEKTTIGDAASGVISYWEPVNIQNGENGHTAVALLFEHPIKRTGIENGHLVGVSDVQNRQPFTYYMGAGWSKNGFATPDEWNRYVEAEKIKRKHPLNVKIK